MRWCKPRCATALLLAAAIAGPLAVARQATASAATAGAAAVPAGTAFGYTGAEQTYTVAPNVLLLGVSAVGASGGGGNIGAILGGYLPVQDGETLYVEVGGQGAFDGGATFGGGGAAGGWPGCPSSCAANTPAASGGGASDVRTCSENATSCPGGGGSDDSRVIVASGGGGVGGEGLSPGFYCDGIPENGEGYNNQALPGGTPADGPIPVAVSGGLVIPGQPANYTYGPLPGVVPTQGGSASPGAGGSLETCTVTGGDGTVDAIFSPTVAGTSGTGALGAPGASITGTPYAAPEGSSGYLPGPGGGGGGGYTGGGSGAAGYVCTYTHGGGPCDDPSAGMSGGGGASFVSSQLAAPFTGSGGSATASVAAVPIVEVDSPTNGAVYSPGQVVDASWSCGGGGTIFQGTSCTGTVSSGSPIVTTPGTHTFTVTVSTAPFGVNVPVSVTYTVSTAPTASIATPAGGASYTYGSVPDSAFTCTDAAGGPGIASCTATVDGGSPFTSGTPLPGGVGSHTITVTAVSDDGLSSTSTAGYSVTPAGTTLIATPQLVLFSPPSGAGLGKVSATLTSGGVPVAGQTVAFTEGKLTLCSAVTAASGTATCSVPALRELAVLLANSYTATFAGSTDDTGSTATTAAIELRAGSGRSAAVSAKAVSTTSVRGTLSRRGRVFARASGRVVGGVETIRLRPVRTIAAGRYRLTLVARSAGRGRRIARSVRLG